MPALNTRFGASGGVTSNDLLWGILPFVVLITDSVPPACAKPPLRYLQAGDSAADNCRVADNQTHFDSVGGVCCGKV